MVYKNLFYRLLFSFLFFIIFFVAINNKFLLFILGTFIYSFVFFEIYKSFKNFFKLIIIYLSSSYFCFVFYFFIFFDYFIFNIFVFTIIFFDSFSYFTGKLIGKNYIFKFISPKKTLEGFLGGYFLTSQQFAKYFQKQGYGNIVNIASIYGVVAPKFEIYNETDMTSPVEYAVIKSGLIHLTKYMARYFKGKNFSKRTQ